MSYITIKLFRDIDADIWVAECDELNIVGTGETLKEALEDFIDDLQTCKETYLHEKDENLGESGKRVKEKLKALFGGD